MILKIFNKEIVDCSSSVNMLYPNPKSRLLLLDIITKLCESEVVTNIINIDLHLQFENPDKNGRKE